MIFSTFRSKAAVVAGSLMLACTALSAQQKNGGDASVMITRNNTDNTPKFLSFGSGSNWKAGQAQELFKQYLGVDGTNTSMVFKNTTTTKAGITTERYTQYYQGIPTEYGGFVVVIRNGRMQFASGNFYNVNYSAPATPALSERVAFGKALAFVHAEKYMWEDPGADRFLSKRYHKDTTYMPTGKLEWIEDYEGTNGDGDRILHLAYSFDIYAVQPVSRQKVFVDAITGRILYANQLIKHTAATGHSLYSGVVPFQTAYTGGTYILFDSTRGNGVYTQNLNDGTSYGAATDFSSATNSWPTSTSDTQALDAQWGGEIVYDYWLNEQGRLSWDNLNGTLYQYVHYSTSYDNAFWDGTEMNYGDGSGCAAGGFTSLVSLDVTAHEIGHGVCQATCNLVYAKEPGGIDEGLSDCWGATIENWGNPHEIDAVSKKTWWMGEEIGCGTPLRRLDSPKLYGLPDTYMGINWYDTVGCTPGSGNDQCGVHTNMGVLSKWYYLLTVGATGTNDLGNTYTVAGQGFTVSQNILYQTELVLPSNCTYPDFRTYSIATATTLYGACSAEVQAVTNAWYAVGVGAAFVPCTPTMGFTVASLGVTENAGSTACPASHTVNIGITPVGPAITGGSATVNIVAAYGTAVSGTDYTISPTSFIFPVGDTATQYATMTIYDNGAVNDDKTLVLGMTLSAGTSDAVLSSSLDSMHITIYNDDSVPHLGGAEYHTLNIGTSATLNNTSAFRGTNKRGRSQWILNASELTAAGVRPGVPISQIAFTVTSKSSTSAFVGYTVSMGNTTMSDYSVSGAFATGLTSVYSGNYTTAVGTDSIDFSTPFTWDGTSNVAVQVCFGANAAAFTANDQMAGIQQSTQVVCDFTGTNTGAGAGCALAFSTTNESLYRPVMRFKQVVPPAAIETTLASTRTWNVSSATEVYFLNPVDTYLIAGVKNMSNDLGCTSATLTGAGTGLTPATFSTMNRSNKEVTITPTINGATTTHDATIYLTNTELGAVSASSLYLLRTSAATDAGINSTNTTIVTPTLSTGTNYVGFTGHFTGVGRYFLVDQPTLCTPPAATITAGGATTFCVGSSVVLNANTGTGYTYQWQANGTNIAGATNASFTADSGASYTVVITQSSCSGTSAATVVTVDSPYTAPISGSAVVCTGQTYTFTDATPGGTWSAVGAASVDASGHVSGSTAGSAIISYSATSTCGTAAVGFNLAVVTTPTVAAITGTDTVCTGATVTLSDATSSGVWSGGGSYASVDASGDVLGATSGTANISYTVTSGGCAASAVATITVLQSPTAAITPAGSVNFCTGASVVLNASTGTGYTYQWQQNGADISGATSASYTADTTSTWTVIVTGTNSCSATAASIATTESGSFVVVPAVAIAATPDTIVCTGSGSVSFTATPTNGGSAPTYQWYVNGTAMGTGNTYSYTPATGDVVSVKLTSNAGCASPDTAMASVNMTVSAYVNPSVAITVSPGDTTCTAVPATFTAVPTYGGAAPTYIWNKNGINVATGPSYTYTPVTGDVVFCMMTSNFPCLLQDTAVSAAVTMTVDVPVANTVTIAASSTTIISGQTVTFTADAPNAGPGGAYQWYANGVAIPGATSAAYITDTLAAGQAITCQVTSSLPCAGPHTNASAGVMVLVTSGVANTAAPVNDFAIVPNPNSGTFAIIGHVIPGDNISIRVTDVLGQVVYTNTLQPQGASMHQVVVLGNSMASGMYLVTVSSSTGTAAYHVAVEK